MSGAGAAKEPTHFCRSQSWLLEIGLPEPNPVPEPPNTVAAPQHCFYITLVIRQNSANEGVEFVPLMAVDESYIWQLRIPAPVGVCGQAPPPLINGHCFVYLLASL